jgi:biopolymer transport protein ExbD
MHVGGGGESGEPDVLAEINTTPLIDVMLVLLIMLIITIPIQTHAVKLEMPTGAPPAVVIKPEVIRIDVGPDGAVRWNDQLVADRETLETRLRAAAQAQIQPELHLRAHKQAPYRHVAAVMASAQRLGVTRIGLVGTEQFVD